MGSKIKHNAFSLTTNTKIEHKKISYSKLKNNNLSSKIKINYFTDIHLRRKKIIKCALLDTCIGPCLPLLDSKVLDHQS